MVAISVLNTRSGSTPRATAAARPYPRSAGSLSNSYTPNCTPAADNTTIAGVPPRATAFDRSVGGAVESRDERGVGVHLRQGGVSAERRQDQRDVAGADVAQLREA